jgi:hypothetical protein
MREPAQMMRIEPRWPVALTVVMAVSLLTLLPGRVRVFPTWVPPLLAIAWLMPMAALKLVRTMRVRKPDWLFPQQGVPEDAPLNWRPTFIDYLFLSYCTATAFSPAEAQPMTSRAML